MPLYVKFTKKGNDTVAKLTLIKKEGYYHEIQKIIMLNDNQHILVKLEDRWVEVEFTKEEVEILASSRLASITITKEIPLLGGVTNDQ